MLLQLWKWLSSEEQSNILSEKNLLADRVLILLRIYYYVIRQV